MSDTSGHPKSTKTPTAADSQDLKAERLAEALRQNLKRRKTAARARLDRPPEGSTTVEET